MNRKAEMGVGTLIIFIAMIMVAAIAAAVLLQTAGSLQQDALATGGAARAEISSAIRLASAHGTDGMDGTIEVLQGAVKLSPGGDPMNFEDIILIFGTSNQTVEFSWSGNETYNTTNQTGTFGIRYLQEHTNHRYGVLQPGELVNLVFEPGWSIGEAEDIEITLIPRVGLPQQLKTQTPHVMTTRRVSLYT